MLGGDWWGRGVARRVPGGRARRPAPSAAEPCKKRRRESVRRSARFMVILLQGTSPPGPLPGAGRGRRGGPLLRPLPQLWGRGERDCAVFSLHRWETVPRVILVGRPGRRQRERRAGGGGRGAGEDEYRAPGAGGSDG